MHKSPYIKLKPRQPVRKGDVHGHGMMSQLSTQFLGKRQSAEIILSNTVASNRDLFFTGRGDTGLLQ